MTKKTIDGADYYQTAHAVAYPLQSKAWGLVVAIALIASTIQL